MKQPKTLPFNLQNGDYLDILDSEDVIIATVNTHENDTKVGEYIVESCNNYPKAIELLKSFVDSCYREDGERFYCEGEYTYNKACKFLNEIENG